MALRRKCFFIDEKNLVAVGRLLDARRAADPFVKEADLLRALLGLGIEAAARGPERLDHRLRREAIAVPVAHVPPRAAYERRRGVAGTSEADDALLVELERRRRAGACRLAFGAAMTGAGASAEELGPLWHGGVLPKHPARRRAACAALKAYLDKPLVEKTA